MSFPRCILNTVMSVAPSSQHYQSIFHPPWAHPCEHSPCPWEVICSQQLPRAACPGCCCSLGQQARTCFIWFYFFSHAPCGPACALPLSKDQS